MIEEQSKVSLLEFTEPASVELKRIMQEHSGKSLRIFVKGGGCSGFQYGFSIEDTPEEDDSVIDVDGINVVVDHLSYPYLVGSTVDYLSSMLSSQFVINNPNAEASCGCGKSFSA